MSATFSIPENEDPSLILTSTIPMLHFRDEEDNSWITVTYRINLKKERNEGRDRERDDEGAGEY